MRIFLSVGHSILKGGGCTSASGYINEYRYNKELALYVKRALESKGHQCDIIQVPEYTYRSMSGEKSYKLPIANSGKYDLVCELHLNASNGNGYGMECLYYPGDKKGYAISNNACKEFEKLGFRNRGPKNGGWLYIINSTRPTAVLFESFFCDNKGDCDRAKRLGYSKIANAIANALTGTSGSVDVKPPKPEGQYFVMTDTPNDVLNVREQATYKSRTVSAYNHKSKIYVHEVVKNDTGTWYKIEYHKGKFGYVSARYCRGIK